MSEAGPPRERLLDAAERLFSEHGFAAVKLRDLERAAGLHHATFYHHAPGGKAQLFAEAMERGLERHAAALEARVDAHQGDLRAGLKAVAAWVLANPAGNHTRMLSTDLSNLPDEAARRLAERAWAGIIGPVARALREARERGDAAFADPMAEVVAGALVASLQALQAANARYPGPRPAQDQAEAFVDVLLDGLQPR